MIVLSHMYPYVLEHSSSRHLLLKMFEADTAVVYSSIVVKRYRRPVHPDTGTIGILRDPDPVFQAESSHLSIQLSLIIGEIQFRFKVNLIEIVKHFQQNSKNVCKLHSKQI